MVVGQRVGRGKDASTHARTGVSTDHTYLSTAQHKRRREPGPAKFRQPLEQFNACPIDVALRVDQAKRDRIVEDFGIMFGRLMQRSHDCWAFGRQTWMFFIH